MTTRGERRCDVLVVGGGLAGSAVACALADLPVDTLIVEARGTSEAGAAELDRRVTALANGSQRILAALDVWPALATQVAPIRMIHVSERGRFGATRIVAEEEGVTALGYTVENAELARALRERLAAASRVQTLVPARVTGVAPEHDCVRVALETDAGPSTVRARLVVAADGVRSAVRASLGIATREHDYAQKAVVFNCRTEAAAAGRAFERFTERGPIALLPLTGGRAAVIWSLPARDADAIASLPDAQFRAELQAAFGQRLGRFSEIGTREVHTLVRVESVAAPAARSVLIGDAALRLHPVAGQGFNLALRDIATLAELIADAVASGGGAVGDAAMLERFTQWRREDRMRVSAFTHGLIELFGERGFGLGVGRGLSLAAFDLVPGAKSLLARQTMGRAGKLPRLARGLRLG